MAACSALAVKPPDFNGVPGRSEVCAIPPPVPSRLRPLLLRPALVLIAIVGLSLSTASAQTQTARRAGREVMHRPSFTQQPSGSGLSPRVRTAHTRPASATAEATVHRVPGVYPSIQSAIDASYDGDTVLIAEGTYYENIRFRGKSITVTSEYLIDGDTTHIERTIIDGSRPANPDSASVVYFLDGEDTTSVLCGVTVTGGRGTRFEMMEGPARMGGGVCFGASGGQLVRNRITRNRVRSRFAIGAGVGTLFPPSSFPHLIILEGNRISDNCAWGESAYLSLDGGGWGGGAYFGNATLRVTGSIFERDTAGGGPWTGGGGLGIRGYDGVFPKAQIAGNVFRGNICREVLNAYPSDATGGGLLLGWMGEVLITENLFEANVAACQYGSTDGGAVMVSDMDTTGYGRKHILRNRFVGNRSYSDCSVTNVTASGGGMELFETLATVSGNTFTGNTALGRNGADGGGLCIFSSSFVVEENVFEQNSSSAFGAATGNGGGMSFGSPPQEGVEQVIANNIFVGNSCGLAGGALATWEWPPTGTPARIVNNTILGNRARTQGGGIVVWTDMNLLLMNNIVWDNLAAGLPDQISNAASATRIIYNDIQGGCVGEGNIDVPPRFLPSAYALIDSSPCIGAGKDSAYLGGESFYSPSRDFLGRVRPAPPGSMPDIGAIENSLPVPLGATPLQLAPIALEFGNIPPGSSSEALEIRLSNRGVTAFEILSLSVSRTEFMLTPQPTLPLRIPPLGAVRLGIVFTPVLPGVFVCDTLVIATTDSLFGRGLVRLTGRGSGLVQCAEAGVLYALSATADGTRLFTLDRSNGAGRLVARYAPPPPPGLSAVGVRPRDNMLYGAFTSKTGTDLYQLSSEMGDLELYRTIAFGEVTSMAFSRSDNLYLVTGQGQLYCSEGGGDPVLVGISGHVFTGLAFNPVTHVLWGVVQDSVFTIEPSSGGASLVGATAWGAPRSSIAFNPLGTLYGLYGINLVTIGNVWGEPTVVGPTGVPDLVGIAMRCDVASLEAESSSELPREVRLLQNYPNPFNATTVIRFELPSASEARLTVFDLLGREVAVLVNETKGPGSHEVQFDAAGLPSGLYFYRLTAGRFVQTRKMLAVK